jgi:hypothetical protein
MTYVYASRDKTATIRFNQSEWAEIERIHSDCGLRRHRVIKLVLSESLRSGQMAQLAEQHAAPKVKAPA